MKKQPCPISPDPSILVKSDILSLRTPSLPKPHHLTKEIDVTTLILTVAITVSSRKGIVGGGLLISLFSTHFSSSIHSSVPNGTEWTASYALPKTSSSEARASLSSFSLASLLQNHRHPSCFRPSFPPFLLLTILSIRTTNTLTKKNRKQGNENCENCDCVCKLIPSAKCRCFPGDRDFVIISARLSCVEM